MDLVDRKDARIKECKEYKTIMDREDHHSHEIIEVDGRLRWLKNEKTSELIDLIGLNELVILLYEKGYTKNSEMYRYIYRSMGVSLFLYWEIFYWDMNNSDSEFYINNMESYIKSSIECESVLMSQIPGL